MAEPLLTRFGDVVTDIEFSIAVNDDQDLQTLVDLARTIQGTSEDRARTEIVGRQQVTT